MSDEAKGGVLLTVLALVALAAGVSAIRRGRAFRRGEARGMARWYFDRDVSWRVRNLAFAQEPFGWAALGAATSMAGVLLRHPVATAVLVMIGSIAFAAGLVVGLVRQIRPPERGKPEWLRERERLARQGRSPCDTA